MTLDLRPGDVVCTTSGALLSRLIRLFGGRVSHTGIGVAPDTIVEALMRVVRRSFVGAYLRKTVVVYRPRDLSPEIIALIVAKAERYVGRTYGFTKIAAQALDRTLGGAYLFRRVAGMDRYPICSWVVAHAYSAAGLHFGCAPGMASPADIDRFCFDHPAKYEQVWPLSRWGG
jgi:hypothetical protein